MFAQPSFKVLIIFSPSFRQNPSVVYLCFCFPNVLFYGHTSLSYFHDFPPHFFHLPGLLWVLLKQGEAVSVLMDGPGAQHSAGGSQGGQKPSQNQEQQSPDRCPLPLILKKVPVQTSCRPPTATPGPPKPHILVVTIIITRDSNPGLMCL